MHGHDMVKYSNTTEMASASEVLHRLSYHPRSHYTPYTGRSIYSYSLAEIYYIPPWISAFYSPLWWQGDCSPICPWLFQYSPSVLGQPVEMTHLSINLSLSWLCKRPTHVWCRSQGLCRLDAISADHSIYIVVSENRIQSPKPVWVLWCS